MTYFGKHSRHYTFVGVGLRLLISDTLWLWSTTKPVLRKFKHVAAGQPNSNPSVSVHHDAQNYMLREKVERFFGKSQTIPSHCHEPWQSHLIPSRCLCISWPPVSCFYNSQYRLGLQSHPLHLPLLLGYSGMNGDLQRNIAENPNDAVRASSRKT